MFLQIFVKPADCDSLRFLWWPQNDISVPAEDYQLIVCPFGATSSPSCAGFALRKVAEDNETGADAETLNTIRRNFYVDDLLKSLDSSDKIIELKESLEFLLKCAGFPLTKYLSNCREVLATIPSSERANKVMNLELDNLGVERALGVNWNTESDNFEFHVDIKSKPISRRGILSIVSQIYDPLGFVQPILLSVKRLMQKLCSKQLTWDEIIPDGEAAMWENWLQELYHLESITISRCFKPKDDWNVKTIELHCFSDASAEGYGAVSYLRFVGDKNQVHCAFVMGKSRVTPLKAVTIPRLELTAAVVVVKMGDMILRELEYKVDRVVYWSDSTTILQYISNTSRRFQTFVANRLAVIHEKSSPSQWRHVDTKRNPADIASRGLLPTQLHSDSVWFHGPKFLWEREDKWPRRPPVLPDVDENDLEIKRDKQVNFVATNSNDNVCGLQQLMTRYSSLSKLKTSVAWLLRFKDYIMKKTWRTGKSYPCPNLSVGCVSVAELDRALVEVVKFVQCQTFRDEMEVLQDHDNFDDPFNLVSKRRLAELPRLSALRKLSPILVNGVIRVGGRLQKSPFPVDIKHQMILPSNHHITGLVINHYHVREGHSGVLHVLASIREKFWVIKGQSAVRRVLRACRSCRARNAKAGEQFMGNLPASRLTPGDRPFTYVGVDYMGPFLVKSGRNQLKRYGALFVCLATKAVHLEVANSLETDSFIQAYRRFVARRGPVKEMFSDNGTNMVGAERQLREGIQHWNAQHFMQSMRQIGIKWTFSPPLASHQSGVWEIMVKLVKKTLRALIGERLLNDETLHTFLVEVERILNDRPLTAMSDDPQDLQPLTPNSILTAKLDSSLPPDVFVKADGYRKSWKLAQLLADHFWSRWIKEYIPLLQRRQKWLRPVRNFAVGDLVLLVNENTKRGVWPRGIIEETYPDAEGMVRRVQVRTQDSTYVRDIRKVCLLEACE